MIKKLKIFCWAILFVTLFTANRLAGQDVYFPYSTRIVFNSDFSGNNEIYMISRNLLTRLTHSTYQNYWPVPDRKGERLLFTANKKGDYDIFMLTLPGGEITQLTSDVADEVDPSWSFDDRFIYFDVRLPGGNNVTMKKELASGKTSPLFPDPPFPSTIVCFQNHRGDEIFFTGKTMFGWAVAKYEQNSGKYVELAKRGGSCRPKVSPDDRQVAYVSSEADGLGDVWLMNADGSHKTNLTWKRNHYYDYYPCFSPDGKMIVFSSSPESAGKKGYHLYRIELATGKIKLVFQSAGIDAHPFWFN